VKRGDELAGVVSSSVRDRQCLIGDVLCADLEEALRATLAAACNFAHANAAATTKKVAMLVCDAMLPVAEKLGFKRDDYDFLLVTAPLSPAVSSEEIAPDRWYCSPND